jgi:enoyl-CoA hydratase
MQCSIGTALRHACKMLRFRLPRSAMSTVISLRRPPLVQVRINRPEARNAVDRTTAEALAAAFRAFEDDSELRVAVLSGAGDHFCAGADLKAVAGDPARMNRLEAEGDGPMGPTRMQLSKPVVAAVSGYCVAGGLELALWCDLRVADESAVFGVFCRRFGVPLIDGGTVRLPRLIGQSRALDMILTGRGVAAHEALEFGLVNRLAARGQLESEAEAVALQIAAHPQACMRHDRASTLEQWSLPATEAMANEFRHGLRALAAGEAAAGAERFRSGAGRHGQPTD